MKFVNPRFLFFAIFIGMFLLLAACSNSTDGKASENGSDDYPEKSITVVVPAGAGGDTDRNTRTLAKNLEDELGVSLVVQNVNGAGGSTGTRQVLDADPDGYTVLAFHDAALINNVLDLTDYSIADDFEVAGIGILDKANTFMVSGDSKFDNLQDMVAYAKDHPGEVKVATETGAFTHLQLLKLQEEADVEFNIVDAGGAADKIKALLGGQVDVVPTSLGLVQEYVDSGKMKSLGVMSDERLELFPDVPTFKEQGYDVVFDKIFFWAFPPETPDDVVNKFSDAMEKVVKENGEFADKLKGYGVNPEYVGPGEAEKLIKETQNNYKEIYDSSK
ncbi:hypothetical protein GCM10011409_15670 [Lentibacillus populi]|uniref:Tripartite tricarboxylate transporter substrate binding protein n=1 Tax=Lentibacillus populi TaxID=1827502 RepID=A0A9W5TWU2_9BACI|nr:tripartite tricarboxylate transporter substrate binding protein [Lentibacillus populi]GGB39007.1 hypothetical protein GCM10011409_15670 [Lentibacillus populi]